MRHEKPYRKCVRCINIVRSRALQMLCLTAGGSSDNVQKRKWEQKGALCIPKKWLCAFASAWSNGKGWNIWPKIRVGCIFQWAKWWLCIWVFSFTLEFSPDYNKLFFLGFIFRIFAIFGVALVVVVRQRINMRIALC